MIAEYSRLTVQFFGVLILAVSVIGMIAPAWLLGLVRKVASHPGGFAFAVIVRILLGAALLTAAQISGFPLVFTTLGWIAIAAAIGLLLMGPGRMHRLVGWVGRFQPMTLRIWLGFSALFGGFLVVAV